MSLYSEITEPCLILLFLMVLFIQSAPRQCALNTHFVKFPHQQPQKYTDYAPNRVPKGILDNVSQTHKMSDPASLTNSESPWGRGGMGNSLTYLRWFLVIVTIMNN